MIDAVVRPQLLSLYPVLNKISAPLLENAFQNGRVVQVTAGTLMWEEPYKCQDFPFMLKGIARINKLAPNGRELHLYSVGPGEECVVATSSLISDTPCSARAYADEDLELALFPLSTFKELLSHSEPFREYVMTNLSENLTQLTQLLTAIAFQNLDQRLAASLLSKASPISTTHQALADELGSVREIISRLLKNFADNGWISLQRGQITVVKPQEFLTFSKQS